MCAPLENYYSFKFGMFRYRWTYIMLRNKIKFEMNFGVKIGGKLVKNTEPKQYEPFFG